MLIWSAAAVLLSSIPVFYVDWPQVSRRAGHLLDSLLHHPYFSVQEIRVIGGGKVGGSQIIAMTGLGRGKSIWKINPGSIEAKVSRHPWVREVVVRREFPQRVVIHVEEWVAKGIAVLGRLYYVNAEGFVFKEVEEGEKVGLPFITGLQLEGIVSHDRSAQERITQAVRLSELFGKNSISLSEIHYGPHGGVVIYPISYPVAVHMGWGDWLEKLKRLKGVLAEWRGKEKLLASLDLSFHDQVVARLRQGADS